MNAKLPIEFFEARNAVRIAKSRRRRYLRDRQLWQEQSAEMKQADDSGGDEARGNRKSLISVSREVVQTADDAREIAVKRMDEDRMNADKDAEAAKLADSRAATKTEAQARMDAEATTADANRRRAEADKAAVDAQLQQQNAQAESDPGTAQRPLPTQIRLLST